MTFLLLADVIECVTCKDLNIACVSAPRGGGGGGGAALPYGPKKMGGICPTLMGIAQHYYGFIDR